ncbi:hypothetical protein DAI22_09g018300 [Oryza sativa Japonica Group]|nr:hypothetical protein DAI22_09g018300 [Oryza sativa Japonica Group]
METTAHLSWFDRSNFIAVIKIVVVSSTSRNYHPPHPVRSNPHTLPDSLPTAYYFTPETIVPFVFPAFKASAASSPSRNLRGIYSSTKDYQWIKDIRVLIWFRLFFRFPLSQYLFGFVSSSDLYCPYSIGLKFIWICHFRFLPSLFNTTDIYLDLFLLQIYTVPIQQH